MHSLRLQETVTRFAEEAAAALHAEIQAGAEVPYELQSQGHGLLGPALYSYHLLTDEFVTQRASALERLPAYAPAADALACFDGLDRYLAGSGVDLARVGEDDRPRTALRALLRDLFEEQGDFQLRPERLRAALVRLEQAAAGSGEETTLVATLHGLTIVSTEIQLTRGLRIARPEALAGLPEAAAAEATPPAHLVALLTLADEDPRSAIAHGQAVLTDLLRALRLFGDGRVTLGALAWARIAGGGWNAIPLGAGGRPRGMLLVTPEQEDELRAFCNLVSRRAPVDEPLAWALRRFELGCERESACEALTDHLLALRALLEPEGPASGMLPGRLAALCATADQRLALTERTLQAIALEQAVVAGTASSGRAGAEGLATDIADHLRALLRDVICGHLEHDLAGLADEILLEREQPAAPAVPASGQEMFADPRESQEVLDLSI